MLDLTDSVAIVTGGGVGIGSAVCRALAASGARAVVVNYAHSGAEAEATAAAVATTGAEAEVLRADVRDDEAARGLVAETMRRFGRVDILVNNAGITRHVPHPDLEDVTDGVWREILETNLLGAFYCARAAAPDLRATNGTIINIASMSAHRGIGASIPYAVSKAALVQLTRNLAMALAPQVRVNSVTPGAVNTRLFRSLFGEDAAAAQEARFAETTPLGRMAVGDDVADVVVGLARAEFVTGQDVIVDGGRHLAY